MKYALGWLLTGTLSCSAAPAGPVPTPLTVDVEHKSVATARSANSEQHQAFAPDPRCTDWQCLEMGQCSFHDGACVAGNGNDCAQSQKCIAAGHCSAARGACTIGGDADCARSLACLEEGQCHAVGQSCAATSNNDCRGTVACTRGERCLAMAGRCVTVAQAAGTEPRVPTPAPPPNTKGPFFEASHLLIQYAGAKRAADTVTRSKEEARVLATRLTVEAKQQGPSGFAALVGQHSDEPGAARRGGSLGRFASKHMDVCHDVFLARRKHMDVCAA